MPQAAQVTEQVAVITKLAPQVSELVDRIGDVLREVDRQQGNGNAA
jgi:hypothetical protein